MLFVTSDTNLVLKLFTIIAYLLKDRLSSALYGFIPHPPFLISVGVALYGADSEHSFVERDNHDYHKNTLSHFIWRYLIECCF